MTRSDGEEERREGGKEEDGSIGRGREEEKIVLSHFVVVCGGKIERMKSVTAAHY